MSDDYTTTVQLAAGPAEVYRALTTLDGLAGWWTTASDDGAATGELTFTFGKPEPLRMRVDVAHPDLAQWTCLGYRPVPDWTDTVLRFELAESADGGCRLVFRQLGLTPQLECYDLCSNSWNHFIATSLRNYLERGVGDPRGSAADRAWREKRAAVAALTS